MTSATAGLPLPPSLARSSPPEVIGIPALYREMWAYAAGARGWFVLSSAMLVASQLVKLLVPWLTAQAIDTLQRAQGAADCLPWIGGVIIVYLVCWSLHGPGRVIERTVSLRVRRAHTDRLYVKLSEAPLVWHAAQHPAELAHRMTQATQALANFTQSQFIYLQNAVNLAGPLLALWWLSSLTGAVALAGLAAVAVMIVVFDRALMRLARDENAAERSHAAALFDCLSNVATVLSLRLEQPTRRLLARRLDTVAVPLQRNITLNEWKWCAVELLGITLTWSLVTLFAWRSQAGGAVLLGSVFMVYQYAQQAGGVISSLAANLQNFARIRTDYASAGPIWSAPRRPAPERVAPAPAEWRHIDLCDLSYRHPGADAADARPSAGLHHLSLRLHAGERIALVGPSGSGKSTLLKLLAGLCEPSHGHIEIDGVAALGVRDLRNHATLIPQEIQMFEASLHENLAFDLDHDAAQVAAAAHIAALAGVIDGLPSGLDTRVAQAGSNLSGGQRQRVCLARGVLAARGSSVLLLDEPTSGLDPVTEAAVYERLDEAFTNVCVIASVHRMSLLDRFDRVVLLDEGRIVDYGRPTELMARQPMFRAMVSAQAVTQGDQAPAHTGALGVSAKA